MDVRTGEGLLPSDGLQLWRVLRFSQRQLAEIFLGHLFTRATQLLKDGNITESYRLVTEHLPPSDVRPGGWQTVLKIKWLCDIKEPELAMNEWEQAQNSAADVPLMQTDILDSLACIPLFYGLPQFHSRALSCIDRAISIEPAIITFKGTKGSLLIETGQIVEGMQLLTEVYSQSDSKNDKAICSYYMAYGLLRTGNIRAAHERLQQAMREYPECIVAERIKTRIFEPAIEEAAL